MAERLPWPMTGIEGFTRAFATVDGVRMHFVSGGRADGRVLVLFPGFPQHWYAWRKILPMLGDHYRIVAPDLPGQGDSDPPPSFDTMTAAKLLRGLIQKIGVDRHSIVAHDVGAWVAYPYVALYGPSVEAFAILDTGIPGISLPDALPWSSDVAWRTWHVAFHNVAGLPEALIKGRERIYLNWFLQRKAANPQIFSDADFEEYFRAFMANGLGGGLGYYRAVTASAQQNRELSAKGMLTMPVLAVRADQGSMPDLVAQLQKIATNVRGTAVTNCGHYLAEEQPEALAKELRDFFS